MTLGCHTGPSLVSTEPFGRRHRRRRWHRTDGPNVQARHRQDRGDLVRRIRRLRCPRPLLPPSFIWSSLRSKVSIRRYSMEPGCQPGRESRSAHVGDSDAYGGGSRTRRARLGSIRSRAISRFSRMTMKRFLRADRRRLTWRCSGLAALASLGSLAALARLAAERLSVRRGRLMDRRRLIVLSVSRMRSGVSVAAGCLSGRYRHSLGPKHESRSHRLRSLGWRFSCR